MEVENEASASCTRLSGHGESQLGGWVRVRRLLLSSKPGICMLLFEADCIQMERSTEVVFFFRILFHSEARSVTHGLSKNHEHYSFMSSPKPSEDDVFVFI